jgi:3-hydroxymyristoyl/3-hydroxydecanoyl-(acyl carrier protein) dehydratase
MQRLRDDRHEAVRLHSSTELRTAPDATTELREIRDVSSALSCLVEAALEPLRSDSTTAAARLAEVTPAMCLGHFADFPAMPVAILMDGIHRLACRHAAAEVHPHVRMVSADVRAARLAFAGESVEFSVKLLETGEGVARYEGRAARRGDPDTVFGTIDLAYELLEADAVIDAPRTSALKELDVSWNR